MEQRISLITLGVRDLTTARHFYEHGLGWHPSSASTEQVVFFQTRAWCSPCMGKGLLRGMPTCRLRAEALGALPWHIMCGSVRTWRHGSPKSRRLVRRSSNRRR